jgi:hypothetical protein
MSPRIAATPVPGSPGQDGDEDRDQEQEDPAEHDP